MFDVDVVDDNKWWVVYAQNRHILYIWWKIVHYYTTVYTILQEGFANFYKFKCNDYRRRTQCDKIDLYRTELLQFWILKETILKKSKFYDFFDTNFWLFYGAEWTDCKRSGL